MADEYVAYPAYDTDVLTALVAAGGPLDGAKLRLYQNDHTPIRADPPAAFDIATFDGYADEAVTWNAVSTADDGTPEVVGLVGEFRPTGTVTPNQIYGANLISGAGTFYAGRKFDPSPVPMVSPADAIQPVVRVRATPSGLIIIIS